MKYFCVLVLACLVQNIYASPAFLTPCKASDKKCLVSSTKKVLAAFIKGLPEYKIPVTDPLFVDGGKSDNPGLSIKYNDLNIHGLKKAKIVDVERSGSDIKLVFELPLVFDGLYELNGKMLILDVTGKGNVDIKTDNVKLTVTLKTTTTKGADGKTYWKVTGFDYKYDFIDKVHIKLSGLFGGNEERAKPIHDMLDNSWKEVIEELGDPIIKQLLSVCVKYVNNFFSKVPVSELELA
ncbi:circadian clock-controlled protein daywake-like [Aricia agestis]|uniref:circadian clock-controlled protein daywake-like n=1 Tax=Aricia agestis TaxID=91739 RepID=UPI001C20B0A1|nr:circadian clock-controlled protein daywake-like [Aricia agestis]